MEYKGYICFQLTATLRNLADVKDTRQQFLSLHLVEELCKIMEVYSHDGDLMLNVCRIFRWLSTFLKNLFCHKSVSCICLYMHFIKNLLEVVVEFGTSPFACGWQLLHKAC